MREVLKVPVYCEVLQSRYVDSVTLMNAAREVRVLEGIDDAALVMGTDANKSLLESAGMLTATGKKAAPDDMILAVRGDSARLEGAAQLAYDLLMKRSAEAPGQRPSAAPRTLLHALQMNSQANLVLVSVGGAHAAAEAGTALAYDRDVLLFSDNVSVQDEIELKKKAVQSGRLMMGPGAGTAIIEGAALGFANAVPGGPVGIVSAAGTGLQEVSVLLARSGVGISQAIGVGGRDLSDAVGGIMTMHALDVLMNDAETRVVVVISKLPSPVVTEKVVQRLQAAEKPSVVIFMGPELEAPPVQRPGGAHVYRASTLRAAAAAAARLVQGEDPADLNAEMEEEARRIEGLAREAARRREHSDENRIYGRGLFSGGTLCEEAMRIWEKWLGPVWSNAPLHPAMLLPDSMQSREHSILDLGEEEFTVGRLHPMIDHELRVQRLLQEALDDEAALVQMDVVLGYGAHADPASELAPAVHEVVQTAGERKGPVVVVSITGTDDDPQGYGVQREKLENAGALVFGSNADASLYAAAYLQEIREAK